MSRGAMLALALACAASGARAFMDELPLKVLSVTPNGDAPMLRGKDAITVTFSRAVIALGADFGPGAMPPELTPFALTGAGASVPGRLRWVTTFSARFDPTDEWPTDLAFDVQINTNLASFDGAALVADENTAPTSFTTAPLSVSMRGVTSQQAAALTDGTWVSAITDPVSSSEMPPDGVLTLHFSHPVDVAMVSASLQLRDANGNPQRGPSVAASTCESRWSGDSCVAVTVQGQLEPGTRYQVALPAGSSYHPLCGQTDAETSFSISGLVPFRFPFLQGLQIPANEYQQTRPTFRRWDMWVRHGLAPSTTAAMVQAAISISPKIAFTVTIKDSSTLRLEGNFEPATTYTITVRDSSSCLDGFNLPLTGSASMMRTADRPEFFITPGMNDYQSQDGALFNSHGGAPDQWQALSQGTTRCLASYSDLRDGNCDGHAPMYVDAFSVSNTQESITGAIASLYNNQASFPAESGVATAGPVSSPMTEALQAVGFPTADLLATTGMFVVNRWDGMSYQGDPTGDSELVSTTDIGVTFAASAQQELIAWATRLDTNADVPGVSISIYNVAQTYRCTPAQVNLITTATTGHDGLVTIDLSAMTDRYPNLVAVINNRGKLSMVRNLPRFNTYNNNGNADARLITDRGLYKVGDTVSIKGYVRDHSGSELDIPTGTFQLQTVWKNSAQAEITPVAVDASLGTFSVQVTVPTDADYKDTLVNLQWTPPAGSASTYARQIGNAQITIADPRPPTVKLTLDTEDGSTVMAANSQIALTVDTTTYTGSPVGSANVDLTWSLNGAGYGVETGVSALLGSAQDTQTTDDDFPTSGTASVVSGDDGHGTLSFSIDGLADHATQFQDGSTVQISASWTGPTREVVTDALTVTVSSSPWEVAVQTTPSNPVPGYTFATTVDLREVVDQSSINGHETSLQLYAWPEGSRATLGADGAPVMPGAALQSCTVQSDGGVNPGCPMTLPSVGKFALVACAQDNSRRQVCTARLLGKEQSEWVTTPLTSFESAFSLVPNQQTFALGDTATFSFFNPFASGCRAFVRWGNKMAKQQMTTAALNTGAQTIDIPVGEECRGGCRAMIVLTAPAQSEGLTLPVPLPVSPLFDFGEATVIESHHTLSVPNHDHELNVAVTVDDSIAEPGSTAGLTITVTDSAGHPVAGEVAVFAVDQAFLDLKPHPAVDVASAFALNMVDSSQFQCHSSLEALASTDGYTVIADRVQSLVQQEPWAQVSSWPLRPSGSGIEGDLQRYVETMSSFITRQGCTYCSNYGPSYGGGGFAGGGIMTDDASMDSFGGGAPMAPPSMSMNGMMPPAAPPPPPPMPPPPPGAPPSRGAASAGSAAPSADIPVRSAFATAPLFAPTVSVPASGSVHVPFPLPDNVGTFNLRAYAVTARSQFGVGETQQIVRNPLSLVASAPRIVRVGDNFACGFTLTAADSSFRGDVQVTATVNRGGLSLAEGAGSQTVRITGAGPQEVVFSFSAAAIAEAELQFSATASVGRDAFTVTLPVLGAQDGVCIATSMAIDGSAAGTPWPEGIVLPDAIPGSGDLVLSAGVGYLPTVQSLAHSLLNLPELPNGNSLVNSLTPAAMLSPYNSGKRDSLLSTSVSNVATSFAELTQFTDEDGLRYSVAKPSFQGQSYINTRLNAWACYVGQRLSESGVAGIDTDMVAQWRTAMVTGLTREAQMAESRGYTFSDYETLAAARLVLGPGDDWMAADGSNAVSTTVSSWLSMNTLVAQASLGSTREGLCSDFCKACTALTLLKADATSAQAAAILQTMISRLRVTGRTGYISEGHDGHATSMAANSLFLSAAASAMGRQSLDGFSTLTLQKLANYIAQGSEDQRWGGVFATGTDAHRGFALSDYDSFTHSNSPNVQLTVSSGNSQLLAGSFTPGHTDDISSVTAWEDLDSPPAPLAFTATGSGELSVAAAMTFIPSQIYSSPVYRGLFVEKIIQAIDPQSGLPTGLPLQAVRLGQMVAVTIQLTTADDVQDLVLEDWVAGGLEPVDPHIDTDALNAGSSCGGMFNSPPPMYGGGRPMMGGMPSRGGSFDAGTYWYFFSCTSFERQTRPDRVSYYSRFVRAGTHSMTYQAMAATSGQFALPPAKASLAAQPEVMGLSSGGSFMVSRVPLSQAQQYVTPTGPQAPMDCPATCIDDCDVTTGQCNPTLSLTTTATTGIGGGKSGHRRQMTSSYIL